MPALTSLFSLFARLLGKFRLRTVLIVPFVLQIGLIVGLVSWLAISSGQHAVQELTLRLRNEISLRVQEKLRSFVQLPQSLNQNNADAVKLSILKPQDTEVVRQYLQRQLLANPALTLVGLGTEQPMYVDVARLDQSDFLKLALWNPQQGPVRNWKVDLNGVLFDEIPTDPKYDHRKRPWYQLAVNRGQAGWSDVYVTKTPPRLVLSATQPLFDEQQRFSGVAVASLSLAGISEFLSNLQVGKTGQSFIIERNGNLLATSTGEVPFILKSGQPQRLSMLDSKDHLTGRTSHFLHEKFPDLKKIQRPTNLEFMIADQRQFVQVLPFADGRGLEWLIVVVIPELDFMEEIQANAWRTLWLVLVALGAVIALGILTARWVTGPITAINQVAGEISQGAWDKTVQLQRHDELGELAAAFNHMTRQLRETLTTLEHRVEERTADLAQANITLEQRVLERSNELEHALAHLMQTEKMATLGGMVAGLTHELNTPLSNVRLAAEALAAEVQNLAQAWDQGLLKRSTLDKFIEYTASTSIMIDRAAQRSANLIESFKQVAVDQSSQRRCQFDLRQIVLHTVQTLEPTLNRTPFQVVIDVETGMIIDGYPGPMEQVLTNLIGNSLAHAFAGRDHGCMTIQATRIGQDLQLVYIDDGIGMHDDITRRIFDPFFTTKAGAGGSGIGMYTVYNLITGLMGGMIQVEGRPGQGARFAMLIPGVCVGRA
ncbi:MAG: hypothetical protein RL748_4465 [Pseudomonadota bacterium]